MRKSLNKLHYLLFVLLMVAMTGCGANNAGTSAGAAGATTAGAITAKLQWKQGGTAARALAAIPAGVANIQFTVSGTGANGAIPVVKSTVGANSTQGQVGGIYPGTVAVAVKAVDASGNPLYEGFATNVNVAAGATTDVGIITMAQPIVKAEEQTCLGCHETALDKTGQNIVANYKQSGHYSNTSFTDANGVEPGCVGCHGPSHNNPDPSANGTSARCFDCHNLNNTNTTLVANHGSYYLANATECSACHQMHNTKLGNMERKSWAQSRHGASDFANLNGGVSGCAMRCHNAKAYIAVVNNPTVNVQGTMTPAPQQITCDACHTNATLGKLRNIPGAKATAFATYTTSTRGYAFAPNNMLNPNKKPYYPDVAGSNLCIICHSGTLEGTATSVGISDPYFAGSSAALTYTSNGTLKPKATVTQHNMPAAAVMYVKFGFTNLSTGTNGAPTASYLASLTSDLDGGTVASTHRKFGTSAIVSDSHFSASHPAPANFLTNGPCAVCHVSGSHSYKIDQAAYNAVCVNCHTSENGNDLTTGIDAFRTYFIEPNKEVYNNAILLAATIVNQKVAAYNATPAGIAAPLNFAIGIDPANSTQPYKVVVYTTFKTGGTYGTDGTLNVNSAALSDFQNAAKVLGYSTNGATDATDVGFGKFLGAISNVALFAKDQGGFAHARTYSRRLIYDSIDFLDDGRLNRSVSATAINLSNTTGTAVAGLYGKGATAYTDGTLRVLASGSTESMLYLVGWNRSTGAWTSPERP
ncbi:MAG TPA: hypothetical protein VJ550_15945 [Geomonas sp.]|nr:hypothetical protein [Geomonas sp.]